MFGRGFHFRINGGDRIPTWSVPACTLNPCGERFWERDEMGDCDLRGKPVFVGILEEVQAKVATFSEAGWRAKLVYDSQFAPTDTAE